MRSVYLDHAATTAVLPEVLEIMIPYFTEKSGNPSSVHAWGRAAHQGGEQIAQAVVAFAAVELLPHRFEVHVRLGHLVSDPLRERIFGAMEQNPRPDQDDQ